MKNSTIQAHNDEFRRSVLTQPIAGGKGLMTRGFKSLEVTTQKKAIEVVINFSNFKVDNDPDDEHDFGIVNVDDTEIFWKIDYYEDESMRYGTRDLLNAYKVLTLMLPDEY